MLIIKKVCGNDENVIEYLSKFQIWFAEGYTKKSIEEVSATFEPVLIVIDAQMKQRVLKDTGIIAGELDINISNVDYTSITENDNLIIFDIKEFNRQSLLSKVLLASSAGSMIAIGGVIYKKKIKSKIKKK